jgi:hypothetical protein
MDTNWVFPPNIEVSKVKQKRMFKMAAVAAVSAIVLAAAPAAAIDPGAKPDKAIASVIPTRPARGGVVVETTDLQPFTHVAYIQVGADLSSIKFEGVKAVRVATKRFSITDKRYCGEGYREPGGSMLCPDVQDEYAVPAYQITYSYNGPAMGSDEYGNTRFTFSVNMRPGDLNATVLQAVSARKTSRAAAAEAFKITTSRSLVQRVVIDESNSAFCDGNYSDGVWTHTKANCEDKETYQTVTVPSDYIAVKVDPASPTATVAADRQIQTEIVLATAEATNLQTIGR